MLLESYLDFDSIHIRPHMHGVLRIVVAADDSSRGELMDYKSLQEACANWAESNILGKALGSKSSSKMALKGLNRLRLKEFYFKRSIDI